MAHSWLNIKKEIFEHFGLNPDVNYVQNLQWHIKTTGE